MAALTSSAPAQIHPALWRADQLAQAAGPCLDTGHADLSAELPGGGWPLGEIVELLLPQPGLGEIRLLGPALSHLPAQRTIVLLQPPHSPNVAGWQAWLPDLSQLLWVAPPRPVDTLWSAEHILRDGHCAAMLCWLPQARPEALRRLQSVARGSDMLCVLLRPASAARIASPAPLRLQLAPAPGGVAIHLIKRRGPQRSEPLLLRLPPFLHVPAFVPVPSSVPVPATATASHARPSALPRRSQSFVDRPASVSAAPGRATDPLAHLSS